MEAEKEIIRVDVSEKLYGFVNGVVIEAGVEFVDVVYQLLMFTETDENKKPVASEEQTKNQRQKLAFAFLSARQESGCLYAYEKNSDTEDDLRKLIIERAKKYLSLEVAGQIEAIILNRENPLKTAYERQGNINYEIDYQKLTAFENEDKETILRVFKSFLKIVTPSQIEANAFVKQFFVREKK